MAIATAVTIAMGLAKVVPSIIGMFGGKDAEDKANQVLDVAKQITGHEYPQSAVDTILKDPEQARQFQEALLNYMIEMRRADSQDIETVNQTIRAEINSTDPYNRRWRATFGYAVALSWLVLFFGIVGAVLWVVAKTPDKAGEVVNALGGLMSSMSILWSVALSILGVTVYKRSQDKKTAAGLSPPGLLETFSDLLGKK